MEASHGLVLPGHERVGNLHDRYAQSVRDSHKFVLLEVWVMHVGQIQHRLVEGGVDLTLSRPIIGNIDLLLSDLMSAYFMDSLSGLF